MGYQSISTTLVGFDSVLVPLHSEAERVFAKESGGAYLESYRAIQTVGVRRLKLL